MSMTGDGPWRAGRPGRKTLVLLSGGIDSALVAALLHKTDRNVEALFIDYGQGPVKAEAQSSAAVADYVSLPLTRVSVHGLALPRSGEIPGRNDLLIAVARAARPDADIAIGIHSGTGYADCSSAHREAWQQLIDVQANGKTRLLAPLIDLDKGEVLTLALEQGIPIDLTHSCEANDLPCGRCSSCGDRIRLLERP